MQPKKLAMTDEDIAIIVRHLNTTRTAIDMIAGDARDAKIMSAHTQGSNQTPSQHVLIDLPNYRSDEWTQEDIDAFYFIWYRASAGGEQALTRIVDDTIRDAEIMNEHERFKDLCPEDRLRLGIGNRVGKL